MKVLICLMVIILGVSCSSQPHFQAPEERYIDQSYTLPKGTDVWGSIGRVHYNSDKHTKNFLIPIPVPLYWEFSWGNRVTIENPIIPMGVRFQVLNNDNFELGLKLALETELNEMSVLDAFYSSSAKLKYKMNKDYAFILSPKYKWSHNLNGGNSSSNFYSADLGFLKQVNDSNALQLNLGFQYYDYLKKSDIPLGMTYVNRLSTKWQYEMTYTNKRTLFLNTSKTHYIDFAFKYFY